MGGGLGDDNKEALPLGNPATTIWLELKRLAKTLKMNPFGQMLCGRSYDHLSAELSGWERCFMAPHSARIGGFVLPTGSAAWPCQFLARKLVFSYELIQSLSI